jgi:hypothetical protein
MSESRKRNEVVSTRLSADELAQIQALAGDRGISTYLRERALAAACQAQSGGGNPHAQFRRGEAWHLIYAPGRVISIRRAPGYRADGVGVWTSRDARALAAALLEAADVAELPDPLDSQSEAAS